MLKRWLKADVLIFAITLSFAAQICVFNIAMKQNPVGIVYGADAPLAGVYVFAKPSMQGGSGGGYNMTDISGGYSMTTGLTTGAYNITTFAYGYIDSERDFVNVTAGQTTTGIDFDLQASGGISGIVTDAVNGTPINGTGIYAELSNGTGNFGFYATTGTDGKYFMATNLPTGKYNVSVIVAPDGYIPQMKTANVVAGVETKNVNLQLARSGIILGKVAAPNGTGLFGISVLAYSGDRAYYGSATTDSSGNYRISAGLGTDNYTVLASGDGNFTEYGGTLNPTNVTVTAGQTTSGINMQLTPVTTPPTPSGTITGRITDQSNNPIARASVTARGSNGTGVVGTDSNGYYNISSGLGTGNDYNVSVTASGYYDASYPSLISVRVGQTTPNINIQMTPQTFGTVTGIVTGDSETTLTTVHINSDGSVSPSTAPISSPDDVTYTLTGNISYPAYTGIVVERSNIRINGNGYTVQGNQGGNGLSLTDINNVTIKNINIQNFLYGIYLENSSNNTLSGNNATANSGGIYLDSSNYNTVNGNNATANIVSSMMFNTTASTGDGICLESSSNNTLSGNIVAANSYYGICVDYNSNGNIVSGNNATANSGDGIDIISSSDNIVSANSATANTGEGIYLYSSNNTVSGNNVTANGDNGIWLDTSSYDIVSVNTATANIFEGIYLSDSSNNTVSCNNATANGVPHSETSAYGIYLSDSSGNIVIGNTAAANNGNGILLDSSSDNNIVCGDNATENYGAGIYLDSSSSNIVCGDNATKNIGVGIYLIGFSDDNTVSGNNATANVDGIYLYSSSSNIVSGNTAIANTADGMYLSDSSNNTVIGNTATANSGDGIDLSTSSSSIVNGNNVTANGKGINLEDCSNDTVSGNTVKVNTADGIYLQGSSYNIVSGNTATNNSIGIALMAGSWYDTMYHNNFVGNVVQASVGGEFVGNAWDDGYPSGGNCWSDYKGKDLYSGQYQNVTGSDGIGDTPYVIDSSDTDNYPLMQPWSLSQSATSISVSPNPVIFGSPVTCIATVSGSRLNGTVTWSTSSIGGSFSQSVCTLSNGTCSATYTDNFTGSVTIAAFYSGDSNNMPSSSSTTLLITSSGPVIYSQNYTSVQAAINNATSGATVVIAPGFYTGSLTVNKTLTIIGEKDVPVFSGGASGVFMNLLSGASGTIVTGIEITNFAEGILVQNASNCRIYDNIISSITGNGIVLQGSSATGNLVFGNAFQETPTPINLTASANGNTIYGNIISCQNTVTLNIGANANSLYDNTVQGSQIIVNMTSTTNNLIYNNNFVATSQITVFMAGGNSWNASYPTGGNYWSDYQSRYPGASEIGNSGIWNTPYVIDGSNRDYYPLMNPWVPMAGHDVAVLGVVAAKTVIGKGYTGNLTISFANNGVYTESFGLTAYANATIIYTSQIGNMGSASQASLTFKWDTSSLAYGNYTVSAWAWPVPGETDVSNNNFTLGVIKVTIPGDLNGDFKVSLSDLTILAKAYGSHCANYDYQGEPASPKWNANADINGDGKVSLSDLQIMAKNYGKSATS